MNDSRTWNSTARGDPHGRRRAAEPRLPRDRARRARCPAVRQSIERLVADFDGADGGVRRGFELREVGGGWRIYVRAEHRRRRRATSCSPRTRPSSRQAALETLAVIAYKQPISRGAIASIRAVNVDSVVRTLLGRGLITEAFTDSETGAIHYDTTDLLLTQLGINSIEELPHDLAAARRRIGGFR